MKNLSIAVCLILVLLFASNTQTKAQDSPQNVVKINILSPILRTASLFYERAISESSSLQLGLFYTGLSIDDTRFRGFGITPEFRYYLSDKGAPQGFFIAPFVRYQNFTLTAEDEFSQSGESKADLNSFGGGLLVGGQWIFKDIISLDVWGGPSYSTSTIKVEEGSEDDFSTGGVTGFGIRAGVTLGIAF